MIISFELIPLEDCLSFNFKVRGRNDDYNINIKVVNGTPYFDTGSCDCAYGSYWGQTAKKLGTYCQHISEALYLLEYLAYIDSTWRKERTRIEEVRQ